MVYRMRTPSAQSEVVSVQVRLLGGFAVSHNGVPIADLNQSRFKDLLGFLIVHHATPLSRAQIAFTLWPDSSDTQAQTNLRNTLFRMRRVFPKLDECLTSNRQELAWRSDAPCSVDLIYFEEALDSASQARRTGDSQAEERALAEGVKHYGGELLPDIFADWALLRRAVLQDLFLGALTRLSEFAVAAGDHQRAQELMRRYIQEEPLDEAAYQRLMHLYQSTGKRALALRLFHDLSTKLHSELGIAPSAKTQSHYWAILESVQGDEQTASPSTIAPPLVGRDDALAAAISVLDPITAGHAPAAALLIEGEAGIGKTRLAETLAGWARQQGQMVLTAACYGSGTAALAPVATWLRQTALDRVGATWRQELTRLLPELAEDLPPTPSASVIAEPWQQQRFHDAIVETFIRQAQPLLLVLDDIQWAAADTLQVISSLLYQADNAPIALLVTRRTGINASRSAPDKWLTELQQRGILSRLTLERLDRNTCAQLATSLATERLTDQAQRALFDFTEGNPLFIVEAIRAGIVSADLNVSADSPTRPALPPKMKAVLQARLNALSPRAIEVAKAASVLGRSFDYELLRTLDCALQDEQNESDLLRALDELWHARIVAPGASQGAIYNFTHDRLRQVAYASLSPARRQALNRAAATELALQAETGSEGIAGQVAYHWEEAGNTRQAITWHERAAAHAASQFAHEETIHHCLRAIALYQEKNSSSPAYNVSSTYAELARAYRFSARHQEATSAYSQALAHMETPLPRVSLLREAGEAATSQMDFVTAQLYFEEALAGLKEIVRRDSRWWETWLDVKQAEAALCYYQADLARFATVLDEVSKPITRYGTARQRADYYGALTQLQFRYDRYTGSAQLMQYVTNALRWAEASGDTEKIALHRFGYAFSLLIVGELADARRELEAAYTAEAEMGNWPVLNQIVVYLLMTLRLQGEVEAVRVRLDECLRLAHQQGNPSYIGAAEGHAAWVAYRSSKHAAARQHCATAIENWQRQAYPFQWIGRLPALTLALEAGDVASAQSEARVLIDANQVRLPVALDNALRTAQNAPVDSSACRRALHCAVALAKENGYL
jgi:DNA-binding SARP family transcriptional activator